MLDDGGENEAILRVGDDGVKGRVKGRRTVDALSDTAGDAGLVDVVGDGRPLPFLCAEEVAACRRVGGAVAIALAFALVAAIAARTLLFFATGVEGAVDLGPPGAADSNSFRAVPSRPAIMTAPLSLQIPSYTQNAALAVSRTEGLVSTRDFFKPFSIVSNAPEPSIACFARPPCVWRYNLRWATVC